MKPVVEMTIEELKAATTISAEELAKAKKDAIAAGKKPRSWCQVDPFVRVPMAWLKRLRKTRSIATYRVAHYLLYRQFKEKDRPFSLGNGALLEEGVGRFAKWRALGELEELGLISIERRPRRSPKITVR